MTLAVLLAVEGARPAGQAPSALVDQLHEAGIGDVRTEPGGDLPTRLRVLAALARESSEPLLLCGTDVLAHTAVLRIMATEPGGGTVALTGPTEGADRHRYAAVRRERNLVAEAGPARGDEDSFLGVLRVGVADLPVLADLAERLADGDSSLALAGPEQPAGVADLLLPGLVRVGRRVAVWRIRLLVADRVAGEVEAASVRARMAAVDEDKARLRLGVKERDDFFTTYFVSPISPWVVRAAARAGLTPTGVTAISVALAVIAALGFAWGARLGLVGGAVLLYVSFLLDCVDGQLARYSRQFSAFGGWLDTMADRSKEYIIYAGLAIGAERAGLGTVWPLALAAMVLQTVRHMTDTWYGALHDEAVARTSPGASGGPAAAIGHAGGSAATAGHAGGSAAATGHAGGPAATAGRPAGGGLGARLGQASERVQADTGSLAYWLKRIIVFPIGERWALIALTAALANGRVALLAVLAWGGFAAAYTLGLRSVRARTMRVPVLAAVDTARHRDDGPLARLLGAAGLPGPLPMAGLAALVAAGLVVVTGTGAVEGAAATGVVLAVGLAVLLLAGLPSRGGHTGALDWLVPAALRAAEYLFVVGVSIAYEVPVPLLFALLFGLALRHYDLTARMEKHAVAAPPRRWDLGWDGRLVLLAALAVAGVATAAVAVLAGYVVVMFLADVFGAWAGTRAPVRAPERLAR